MRPPRLTEAQELILATLFLLAMMAAAYALTYCRPVLDGK